MNPLVELNLALILFVPWYSILAVLFWVYPRQPRTGARKLFDTASLVVATALSACSMYWSIGVAGTQYGHMWQQILATSVSYGVFLAAMTIAIVARARWLRRHRAAGTAAASPSPHGSTP